MKKHIFTLVLMTLSVCTYAGGFKKVGVGKEYGEPIYKGIGTIHGKYTRNYEDYTVMGVENPVCFEPVFDARRQEIFASSSHFCFGNSKQAHQILKLPLKAKQGCFYEGQATITIQDFSNYSALDATVFDMTTLLSAKNVSKAKITCDQ